MSRRRDRPPLKAAGIVFLALIIGVVTVIYLQFRGDLSPRVALTLISDRAGLVMDAGSKVTYNGVIIGRVGNVASARARRKDDGEGDARRRPPLSGQHSGQRARRHQGQHGVRKQVRGAVDAEKPGPNRLTSSDVIDASSVTTEFNTLFETVTSIAEKVDPVKLNVTLSATAEALNGLGAKFGQSLVNGNAVLDDVNPQMPQIRRDVQRLSDLADVYTKASPDLWNALDNLVTTAHSLNAQQKDIDAALLASIGFGNTGADIFERGSPYFVRAMADLVPSTPTARHVQPGTLLQPSAISPRCHRPRWMPSAATDTRSPR